MRAPRQGGGPAERMLRRVRQAVEKMDARILRGRAQLTRLREELSELSSERAKLVDVLRQWGEEPLSEEERLSLQEIDELLGIRSLR